MPNRASAKFRIFPPTAHLPTAEPSDRVGVGHKIRKNPPHHVKVSAVKDDKNVVKVELADLSAKAQREIKKVKEAKDKVDKKKLEEEKKKADELKKKAEEEKKKEEAKKAEGIDAKL